MITGLIWPKSPDLNFDGKIDYNDKKYWSEAKDFKLAGYTDRRLPTIKELYSLIMYNGA